MTDAVQKKVRNPRYDIAKGIAIYLVVLGHATALQAFHTGIDFIHMPVFFFISGWFFAKYFKAPETQEGPQLKGRQKGCSCLSWSGQLWRSSSIWYFAQFKARSLLINRQKSSWLSLSTCVAVYCLDRIPVYKSLMRG